MTQTWVNSVPAFYIDGARVNEEIGFNYQLINPTKTIQQEWVQEFRNLEECKPDFFISPFDACNERCVLQRYEDNKATYLHESLRDYKGKVSILEATNALSEFGFTWEYHEGEYSFKQTEKPTAKYSDGEPRLWSGASEFKLKAWQKVLK